MMSLTLQIQPRRSIGNKRGLSSHLEVLDEHGVVCDRYEFMCSTVDQFTVRELNEAIDKATGVLGGKLDGTSIGINQVAAYLDARGVNFWREFGYAGKEEEGGQVSLNQFLIALKTYLAFLSDAKRTPLSVDFPDF